MPFTLEQQYQICTVLSLSPNPENLNRIESICRERESRSEFFVRECSSILQSIADIESKMSLITGSDKIAIIQADVLKYNEKYKILGFLMAWREKLKKLGILLEIPPNFEIIDDYLQMIGAPTPGFPVYSLRLNRS